MMPPYDAPAIFEEIGLRIGVAIYKKPPMINHERSFEVK